MIPTIGMHAHSDPPVRTPSVAPLTLWCGLAAPICEFAAETEMDGVNNLAGGGSSPHDPGMEARVAVLEEIASATKHAVAGLQQEVHDLRTETSRRDEALRDAIETDFRVMFGALITVALGLAALMAKGFHWL
jgi:hypothetical protein